MFSPKQLALGIVGGILLATAGITAAHADPPQEEYSIGPASLREVGEAGALLFPVFAAAHKDQHAASGPAFFAYCIEMGVKARFDVDIELGEWNEFPGTNNFADDPVVQRRVGWIINHSYPAVELPELRRATGIEELTAAQAIAGTQYAIWQLTDGDRRELSKNAAALRTYLTGDANVGLPEEDVRPEVRLAVDVGANHELGAPIGPVVVSGNTEPITVASPDDVAFVDADGQALDTTKLPSGAEFFLAVPGDAGSGAAVVEARADVARAHGSILKVPSATSAQTHAQTLILVTNGEEVATDSTEIHWITPKLPTVVEPIIPSVEVEVCKSPGDSPDAHLLPVPTPGITYDFSSDAVYPGAVVTVTATPADGFVLGTAPGWELAGDGTATTEIHIPDPECPAEAPPAPAEPEPVEPEPIEPEEPALPETGAPSIGLISLALITGGLGTFIVTRARVVR